MISFPIKNRNTEPNSKYYLDNYLEISQSNKATSLTLFRSFDCNFILILYSYSLSQTLSPNLPNFLNLNHVMNALISPPPSQRINRYCSWKPIITSYIFWLQIFGDGTIIWLKLAFFQYMYQRKYVRNPHKMVITHKLRQRRWVQAVLYIHNSLL